MISDGTHRLSRISDTTLNRARTHRLRTTVLEGYGGHSPNSETETEGLVLNLNLCHCCYNISRKSPRLNHLCVCLHVYGAEV